MTLVRGSTDRLRLDWRNGYYATGPDGTRYVVQTEYVRGERPAHYPVIRRPGVYYKLEDSGFWQVASDCPYGEDPTVNQAKRVCEFDAWDRAGRPLK